MKNYNNNYFNNKEEDYNSDIDGWWGHPDRN
jgi:hypothetical protein